MRKNLAIIALLACAAVFAFGIIELFELRFKGGDVYPPYSSLRADPLGTMALYESLGKMPGITVRRDFSASSGLPDQPGTVYLHLAAKRGEWKSAPDDLSQEVKKFVSGGGRLVITYYPQTISFSHAWDDDETNSEPSESGETNAAPAHPEKKKKRTDAGENEQKFVSLEDAWGFHEGFQSLESDGETYTPAVVKNKSGLALPPSLDWHSGMIFTNCDPAWRTIYARGTNAVVIERKFGEGSAVIASDSFFVSNEAMLNDRHADLLAWLLGKNTRVVFDEAHLGNVESPGVATLMRKYRLHGLALGLLLLAGLFIWKNSTSLAPAYASEQRENFVAGKDSGAGFVNLLRRNIPVQKIFEICFAEWKKSAAKSASVSRTRLQQAEAIFESENSRPPKDRDPIAAYRKVSETLRKQQPLL
ncbi:MAG TPA: DUF4350 domain-containing protein [Candidatus Angelobacter sp.]|nr:DUF4350 domain-containing protein [Candidatus Angelobacter sp.]